MLAGSAPNKHPLRKKKEKEKEKKKKRETTRVYLITTG